jgi:hypothetical protein
MTGDDDIRRFSKEWVRDNWDYNRDSGPPLVQLVKAVHESHIFLPGITGAALACSAFWLVGASEAKILSVGVTAIGGGYALFFQVWWCSTLSDPGDD